MLLVFILMSRAHILQEGGGIPGQIHAVRPMCQSAPQNTSKLLEMSEEQALKAHDMLHDATGLLSVSSTKAERELHNAHAVEHVAERSVL